jgi:hypothetical protein
MTTLSYGTLRNKVFFGLDLLETPWNILLTVVGLLRDKTNSDALDANTELKSYGLLSALACFDFTVQLIFISVLLSRTL